LNTTAITLTTARLMATTMKKSPFVTLSGFVEVQSNENKTINCNEEDPYNYCGNTHCCICWVNCTLQLTTQSHCMWLGWSC